MKKLFTPTICLVLLAISAAAFAAGGYLPWPVNKTAPVQNLKGIAPAVGASRCDAVTGTSAVQKSYSTATYLGIGATAYHPTTGAPIVVKWKENGVQVWTGSSYEATNDQGKNFTTLTAQAFSNHTTNFCVRRQ